MVLSSWGLDLLHCEPSTWSLLRKRGQSRREPNLPFQWAVCNLEWTFSLWCFRVLRENLALRGWSPRTNSEVGQKNQQPLSWSHPQHHLWGFRLHWVWVIAEIQDWSWTFKLRAMHSSGTVSGVKVQVTVGTFKSVEWSHKTFWLQFNCCITITQVKEVNKQTNKKPQLACSSWIQRIWILQQHEEKCNLIYSCVR